jgi:hypothetical protein
VTDGKVLSLVRSGTTLYAGGLFSNVGPWTGGGLRFTAGANAPLAGGAPVRGSVSAAIPDGAGGWFIGGSFDSVGGQAHPNIARIQPDGSVASWPGGAGSAVNALALSGGVLYAGGSFSNAGGQPRSRLAAFDAETGALLAWNPGANTTVDALAAAGSTIYVGGVFSMVGGQARSCLAAVDAGGGVTPWNPSVSDTLTMFPEVMVLQLNGSTLYAGGRFNKVGSTVRSQVAAFDAGSGALTSWNPNAGGEVHVIATNGTSVGSSGFGVARFTGRA